MANTTDFINNSRAAEFMKYDQVNKSYFKNCEIKKNGTTTWNFNRGISIWACSGIVFEDNFFEGTRDYGIQCLNAVTTVKRGRIKNVIKGMDCNFTMPNIFIDANNNAQQLLVDDVDFEGNGFDIYSNAAPNLLYPFKISNNQFRKISPATPGITQNYGIFMRGEAAFAIGPYNGFTGKPLAINLLSNGISENRIFCNQFSQAGNAGILSQYNNEGLVITGNHFLSNVATELEVFGTSTNKGRIKELQQFNTFVAAGNCFDDPDKPIKALSNTTVSFKYFVFNLNGTPEACENPVVGTNNYTTSNASSEFDIETDCESSEPFEGITEEDLADARILTSLRKAVLDTYPQNETAKIAYFQAAAQQAAYLDTLLKSAAEVKNFNKIESLLLGEQTNKARREAIGLQTSLKNFTRAQVLIDSMPVLEQDDEWFKIIMEVNFDMFQSAGMYELTSAQEDSLMEIAGTSHSLMSGYACALLSICKGYECPVDISFLEERSFAAPPNVEAVTLYPNPVSGILNIACPDYINETLYLDMFDLSGRIVKSLRFNNIGLFSFDCSDIPQATYYLRLYHSKDLVHHLRVIILH